MVASFRLRNGAAIRKLHAMGLAAIATGLMPAAAYADAWTMPAGQGRTIVTGIYSHAGDSFDDHGHAFNANDYNQYNVYFSTEYGLTNNLTLLATPSLRRVTVQNGKDSFGLGYTEVGARYKVAGGGNFVVSLQSTVLIPGQRRDDIAAQIGSTDTQIDTRVQAGYSFKIGNLDGFTIAQAGYRLRSRGEPNEVHADVTLGLHLTKKLMLLATDYNTVSDGTGSRYPSYRYSTAYAGAVYDLTDHLSLQLGGIATVSGRNALRERGVYTGVWIKF
jgi:outer membrane receptor for ferric coprogen and ferric-rhodotorulic acid